MNVEMVVVLLIICFPLLLIYILFVLFLLSNRQSHLRVTVQGRFKKAIPFSVVYTGQALSESLCQLPDRLMFRAVLKLLKKMQPALRMELQGDRPYILSPLMCTAQNIGKSRRT